MNSGFKVFCLLSRKCSPGVKVPKTQLVCHPYIDAHCRAQCVSLQNKGESKPLEINTNLKIDSRSGKSASKFKKNMQHILFKCMCTVHVVSKEPFCWLLLSEWRGMGFLKLKSYLNSESSEVFVYQADIFLLHIAVKKKNSSSLSEFTRQLLPNPASGHSLPHKRLRSNFIVRPNFPQSFSLMNINNKTACMSEMCFITLVVPVKRS